MSKQRVVYVGLAVLLVSLLLSCSADPVKPSWSTNNNANITQIDITPFGNFTLRQGHQWFSQTLQATRIQGIDVTGTQDEQLTLFAQGKQYSITNNKKCTEHSTSGSYQDPLSLISLAKFVGNAVVNSKNTYHWAYKAGSLLAVDFWTTVSQPFIPVRVTFMQGTVGLQIDFQTFQNSIPDSSVFNIPSFCPAK